MRGFRTKIALHVVLLLLFSAVITNALAVLFAQGVLVRDHIDQQVSRLDIMGRLIVAPPFVPGDQPAAERAFAASGILGDAGWSAVLLVDPAGDTLYERIGSTGSDAVLQDATVTVLQTGRPHKANMGMMWAAFWWQPHSMLVSVPIVAEGRLQGAVAAIVPLEPVYNKLRQYNKPVWILILLNTAILSLAGLYRIFRIYLRPIDRIVRQADGFSADEDLFFTFRREDDELNRLSSSLNRMLKKISTDQEKLKQTVVRLEAANAELQRAQHEIIRSEKMAAVGRLAAGIAHEIGNPIGIVLGYLDLLKRSDLAPREYDDFARRAEAEIQRISTIISQLLDLARPKENVSAGAISVHAVLEDILDVMAHQPIMSGIEIRKRLKAANDTVWGNADQLRQVFLNLLLNAADAIENMSGKARGRIAIVTSTSSRGASGAAQWIAIEVGDNGEGIAEDRLASIFDPFYTTKEPGKGTGLGLAVSFMIIEQMGGTIEARSVVAKGTTLVIHMPMYGQSANVDTADKPLLKGEDARS
jgi:two-component system, NtrC family, sensor kinase